MTRLSKTSATDSLNLFEQSLKRLTMRKLRDTYKARVEAARLTKPDYMDFLREIVQDEVQARDETQFAAKMAKARFPEVKTLASFDLSFQTSITSQELEALARLDFIEERRNVVFVGPPGVGKTHLAIALGVKAVTEGHKVLFTTAESLVDSLFSGAADGTVKRKLKRYASFDLIIVDELGYTAMPLMASNYLFQFVSQAYQRKSLVLTSNRPFQEWGEVLSNPEIAAATLDRLLHDAQVYSLKGSSYRLRGMKKRATSTSPPPGEVTPDTLCTT